MADLIERLVRRSPQIETETAWSVVDAEHLLCGGAPLGDFVPLLAEREALHVLRPHSGGAAQFAAVAGGVLL